jgi:hypothetical protein
MLPGCKLTTQALAYILAVGILSRCGKQYLEKTPAMQTAINPGDVPAPAPPSRQGI